MTPSRFGDARQRVERARTGADFSPFSFHFQVNPFAFQAKSFQQVSPLVGGPLGRTPWSARVPLDRLYAKRLSVAIPSYRL
jgi:hypothetical protein